MTVEHVIAEQQTQIAERDALLAERDAMLADERKKVEQLQKDLALLKREIERLLRGGRRNDTIAPGQGVLFPIEPVPASTEDPTPAHANEAPDGETPPDPKKRRRQPSGSSRKIDTSALARRDEIHDVPEAERVCRTTGLPLVELGEKVFEEIHFERAKLSVVVHRRKVYGLAPADATERKAEAVIAPMPTRPLDDCAASASLLAWILVQKYCNHLPLHRQEAIFQREGLRLPRQTTCDWVLGGAELLTPIVDHLFIRIREGPVAQLDDTPVKCQGGKGQGMSRAYLWSFTSPGVEGVVFRFKTGRGADQIVDELVGVKGYLVGDGLSTNKSAAIKAGDKLVLVGCWAHTLRKFRDALKESSAVAKLYMHDIGELYAIEREADALDATPDERLQLRKQKGPEIRARMKARLAGWRERYSEASSMAKALTYLENQWEPLGRFLEHGLVPLDNNRCERSIRPIAVGRRNWLFAGSERGGKAAATMYSLVETCRLNGVDPLAYLEDVLIRVRETGPEGIADLAPDRWAANAARRTEDSLVLV